MNPSHSKKESFEVFAGILFNKATKEELYWDVIAEGDLSFFLHNYRIDKYGEVTNVLSLPKFLWEIKEKIHE